MAKNVVYMPGDRISLPVSAGVTAGDPVRVGDLNGVAMTARAKVDVAPTHADYNWGGGNPTGSASVWLEGIFEVEVAVTASVTVGQKIYMSATGLTQADNDGGTPTPAAYPQWGVAVKAVTKGASDTSLIVPVRIKN